MRDRRAAPEREVRQMRYVMFTYPDPELVARYDDLSIDEMKADVARHIAWFEKHRAHIDGGEELGYPREARSLRRRGGRVVVSDGPFVETKEMLGGFIVLEVTDLDEAVRIAAEWPSLETEGAGVTLQPVYVREP